MSAIEHSPVLARQLENELGVPVIAGEFESAAIPKESLDAVCSFHVVEHVPDPFSHLEAAYKSLREGGFLFIATPNANSWQHFIPGLLSPNFDSAHLRIFTRKSLEACAKKVGFSIVRAFTPEYTTAWLRVASKLLRRLKGENEETTAGKYAGSSSHLRNLILRAIAIGTIPLRTFQAGTGGGNELFIVLRKDAEIAPPL